MTTDVVAVCPECQSPRPDMSTVCPTCGAPPAGSEKRATEEEVRDADLEPYVTLRYIAKLFKVLAVLMAVLSIGEVVLGFTAPEATSLADLISAFTRLIVLAGLMWSAGDLTLLVIDAGHDLRVARILLGRINHEMHRKNNEDAKSSAS